MILGESQFQAVAPWPLPHRDDCFFYHSLDFPGGETIEGAWDVRGRFKEYIGGYDIHGKTVLDVGTASGFLAFSAELAGAKVTAVDMLDGREVRHLQFYDQAFHGDRRAWLVNYNDFLTRLKNSFWYAWHKLNSEVETVYTPIDSFPYWDRRFDVVFAGAIIEHLSDPVTAIGNLARMANEAVIIAFTPVEETDELTMRSANDWSNRQFNYTWWTLSRGLYTRIFENLGFEVSFVAATATTGSIEAVRPTIVARRAKALPVFNEI